MDNPIKMDDDWRYRYDSGKHHIAMYIISVSLPSPTTSSPVQLNEKRRGCHQEIPQTGAHEAWRLRVVSWDVGSWDQGDCVAWREKDVFGTC